MYMPFTGRDRVLSLFEYKAINYIGLVPVLTKAIQEQQTQIEELKKQLEAISLQLKKLEEQK
jgi:hypothetical protein